MRSEASSGEQSATKQFFHACLRALVRAERDGRAPKRFTGVGQEVWKTFRNELTAADLVAICIQDAGTTMPIPFNPILWWPGWPKQPHLHPTVEDAERWISQEVAQVDQRCEPYLREQADLLGIDIPTAKAVDALPTPPRHEQWLELPSTGGWLAYALSTRSDSDLYFWENFHVVCGTPQEMLFAGLIAWELGAPPRTELPIRLDDPDLTATLKAGETYHAVVGQRGLHGHRDLRILHHDGKQPLWI